MYTHIAVVLKLGSMKILEQTGEGWIGLVNLWHDIIVTKVSCVKSTLITLLQPFFKSQFDKNCIREYYHNFPWDSLHIAYSSVYPYKQL